MLEGFKNHINQHLNFLKEKKLLIAISGGIDSVVLTHLCHNINLDITLAHCNFKLRGTESDADEHFVRDFATSLNLEVFVERFETENYAKSEKLSIQMAARVLRYDWFKTLAAQLQCDYILTAHQADDNLETFLINFTRGTGLSGLTGIPAVNGSIVRPLLPFSRAAIETYSATHKIAWSEDRSNSSTKYVRNKLRHEVVPILKEINPQLLDSFQHTLEHLNDTADIVDESLNAVAKRAITTIDATGISFKVSEFKKVNNPKAYLFEMFKTYGFTEWNDIKALLDAQSGKQVVSNSHRLIKHREHLILTKLQSEKHSSISILNANSTLETPLGVLSFEEVKSSSENSKKLIYIDRETIVFPLELRPWKAGDYFYPLGMNGKKKLSKYLKDEKLSRVEKENSWVLTSQERIVWVVGQRADKRFKLEEQTKNILKIELI